VVLWVVGFPDRALAADVEQIRRLRKSQGEVPIIVAASGLDRVSRSFSPWSFDPDTAKTDAERKVRKWLGEVSRTLVEAGAREVIGCAAGESGTDEAAQYNLESLDRALKGFFPAVRREGAENVSTEDEQSRRRPS
jgi:predicted GTPase